jgi:hypothetical protein
MKFIKNETYSINVENIDYIYCSDCELIFYFKDNFYFLNVENEFYCASCDEKQTKALKQTLSAFFGFLKDPNEIFFDLNATNLGFIWAEKTIKP